MAIPFSLAISLVISTDDKGQKIITRFKDSISKTVNSQEIVFAENNGEDLVTENITFKVDLK